MFLLTYVEKLELIEAAVKRFKKKQLAFARGEATFQDVLDLSNREITSASGLGFDELLKCRLQAEVDATKVGGVGK